MARCLGFYGDGISFRVVFSPSFWLRVLPGGARLVQPIWMSERRILGGGWTCGVSFRLFPSSSGWWRLISSMFLARTSCCKTTHANCYCGAWPGWAVPVSVLPLTLQDTGWGMGRAQRKAVLEASIYITNQLLIQERSDNLFGFSKAIQYPGVKYRAGSQRNLE